MADIHYSFAYTTVDHNGRAENGTVTMDLDRAIRGDADLAWVEKLIRDHKNAAKVTITKWSQS